jgi:hypothetical protein
MMIIPSGNFIRGFVRKARLRSLLQALLVLNLSHNISHMWDLYQHPNPWMTWSTSHVQWI